MSTIWRGCTFRTRPAIYYASADTRLHVASTTVDHLVDFALHTPADPQRSADCVAQRCELVAKNLAYLGRG